MEQCQNLVIAFCPSLLVGFCNKLFYIKLLFIFSITTILQDSGLEIVFFSVLILREGVTAPLGPFTFHVCSPLAAWLRWWRKKKLWTYKEAEGWKYLCCWSWDGCRVHNSIIKNLPFLFLRSICIKTGMGHDHVSSIVCSSPSFDWSRTNFQFNVYFLTKTGNMWGCFHLRNKPEGPPAPDLHLCCCAVRVWHLQAACLYSLYISGRWGCHSAALCFIHNCPVMKILLALS